MSGEAEKIPPGQSERMRFGRRREPEGKVVQAAPFKTVRNCFIAGESTLLFV